MFRGFDGVVTDLWHLNFGRPGNKHNVLFTHMEALIEESLIAADDRRHGASYLSQWVSIKDSLEDVSAIPRKHIHSL